MSNVDYRYEIVRLDSFKNWTISYIKSEKLAAVGFYFTGQNELIKCFECDLEISEWPEGLRVVVFHKKFSSKCRFAHQLSCNNVPIDLDDRRRGKNVSDIKNVYDDMEHNEFMLDIETAKHPEYCFYQARLESFTSWSPAKYPIRSKLAESGFYCTGHLDQVICFYCGVGLMDWDDTMEPWKMHYRWASKCFYVLKIKGQDYLQHPYENIYEKEKKLVHYSSPEMQLAGFGMKTQDPQNSHSNIENITSSILTLSIKDKKVENKDFDKLYDAKASSKSSDKEESKLICKICSLKERNILFLPCGHIITCANCCARLNNECLYCHDEIRYMTRVYYK